MCDTFSVEITTVRIKRDLLLQLRLERGWTQEEVAEKVGIDARTYRRYEREEISVTHRAGQFEILRSIAAVFGLTGPSELMGDADMAPTMRRGSERGASSAPLSRQPAPLGDDGAYPPDAPFRADWYVHREPEEAEALNKLHTAVAPVVLQGPCLHGKGYMLSYLLAETTTHKLWGNTPSTLVRLNLANLRPDSLRSLDDLLREVGRVALEQIDPERAGQRLQDAWSGPGGEKLKLSRLIKHDFLAQGLLLVALEKVERLHGCSFQDDFFALLRGWAESGTTEPWSRLRLLLTVATEPTLLDSIDYSSFFALAHPIRLGSLSRAQIEQMAGLYGTAPPAAAVDQLEALTNGHPYLTRLALYQASVRAIRLDQVLSGVHDTGVFAYHLKTLHRWLEKEGLLPMVGGVLRDPMYPLSFRDYCRLYSQGLIVEDSAGVFRLRCPLYANYFEPLCRSR